MMDLDELRSAQSRERQASQLQHLRDGFYEEAASFIQGLRTERERAAAQTDYSFAYDDPEVQRLTDEIQTAEEVVESLYERRVGKVVKMASFDAAGMAVDAEGLTAEEADLFATLVGNIESNRERVLDALSGTAGGDENGAAGPPPGTSNPATTARDQSPAADAGREAPEAAGPPADGESGADEPVHIGNEPAADGPVSTADEASPAGAQRASSDAERAPTPDAGAGREAARDSASTTEPTHEGSGGGGRGPMPDSHDDGMDAASAMGGESAGRSEEVPGGVPEAAGTDTAASGTDATDGAATGDTGQPTSPAEGSHSVGGSTTGSGPDTGPSPGPGDGVEGGTSESGVGTTNSSPGQRPEESDSPAAPSPSDLQSASPTDEGTDSGSESGPATPSGSGEASGTLVRVTADVGEIFGVDGRAYDLAAGDVVVLPPDNAAPLVEDDSAERLDSAVSFSG